MYEDEAGIILCHYCEESAEIEIVGISDMYLCSSAECAQSCLYYNIGEQSIEY